MPARWPEGSCEGVTPTTIALGRRRRPAVRLALLVLMVGAAYATIVLTGSLSTHRVQGWVGGGGGLAPVAFVLISAVLTVACFPGPLLAGASGYLFGTAEGTVLSIVAATLGATMAFSIARGMAGDAVVALGGPRLRALGEWVGRRDFLSVLYARVAPGAPATLVNYAAGLSPARLPAFVAATVLGVAPRAFAYTALGGHLGNLTSPEALVAVGVLVGMAVGGLALARREHRAERRRVAADRPAGSAMRPA
jgi:uncharacterized membrane protein YdjX (TVP38/TMEM64 family)